MDSPRLQLADLPAEAQPAITAWRAALDRDLPGAITGLYLVGSLALGDFVPRSSDIDFVALLAPDADLDQLPRLHRQLARIIPKRHIDGIYLRPEELGRPPIGVGPVAHEGVVRFGAADERHAVTWLTLREHGVVVTGEPPSTLGIWGDSAAAAAYSRQNLADYWRPWLARRRRRIFPLTDAEVSWACLGIARLHAMITLGEIVSKTEGGQHALREFPRHQAILLEALQLRRGERSTWAERRSRRDAVAQFMEELIDSVRD